jgi:Tol biopolymer transport system component
MKSMGVKPRTRFIPVLAMLVAIAWVLPAHATFPGKNGRIAFIQGPDVYTMKSDGSDVRQLTALTDDNPAFWAAWSPDGKQLVFSEFPAPDFFGQLWLMNADGSNQHLLLDDPGFDDEAPSFSPDGRQIIFTRCRPFHNEFPCAISRVQVDGTGLQALTPERIELDDIEPVYSPDGNQIAFASFGRDGVLGAIYLMNPDGSNIRQLTPAVIGGSLADWSPDGQFLVFSDHCCNPALASIFTIRKDRRKLREVTRNQGKYTDGAASWSPQGDAIVFRRTNEADGSAGIWIVRMDGTGEKLLRAIPEPALPTYQVRVMRRRLHPGAHAHAKQIEDGGMYPRWGVAQ